ncbi:DUF3943 domain-containing protein [Haliangium sp.]|uniref:DUF3943 domain-containing protein n=1 Tax=Haliangium sp. TaxID=2663208 RepID=UPI003D0AEC80
MRRSENTWFGSASAFARGGLALIAAAVHLIVPSTTWAQDTAARSAAGGQPCHLGDDGCYLDFDGTVRDADADYRALHQRRRPHYLRAAVEMTLALGAGTTWYWLDRERQVADWDYPSLQQRLSLDVLRMDNNDFGINFLAHPLDGAAFHALARANQLSFAESFGYGMLTSLAWEYGLEFREKVSINDIIVTPAAGITIGEFAHRLAQYVNSAPGGGRWWHHLAGYAIGPTVAIHDRLDGYRTPPRPGAAHQGFRRDLGHSFELSYGVSQASLPEDETARIHEFGVDGRLVAIPGYLRPGQLWRLFTDADITSLRGRLGFGAGGHGIDIYADTVLLGLYWQRIPAGGIGVGAALGTAVGFAFRDQSHGSWRDRVGVSHLPGLALDLDLIAPYAQFELRARLHGDFAGVHASPYAQWEATYPDEIGKSILRKQGYYYGWGWSGRLRASLRLPYLTLGGALFHGRYASQEGLDRSQENLTIDVEASDTVRDYELWLRLQLFSTPLHVQLGAYSQRRKSHLGEFRSRSRLDRYFLSLGMLL